LIDFLTYIYQQLSTCSDRLFLELAPQGTLFPYVTYNVPTSLYGENREDFILEVDVWGNDTNTFDIEVMTDNIDRLLNKSKMLDSNIQVSIYRINRMMIPDEDENVRRRQLRYQCKTYFRN